MSIPTRSASALATASRSTVAAPAPTDVAHACFAWVRDESHLERALDDLSALFEVRAGRSQSSRPAPLFGVWVGDGEASDEAVFESLARGLNSFRMAGVWSLAWVDDETLTRDDLLTALMQCAPGDGSACRFVPAYPSDRADLAAEVDDLRRRHPHVVVPPLVQDPHAGSV
ncbi:MAG: hypothetical protein AAGA20_24860, partial [Planctomycetota bacterium]